MAEATQVTHTITNQPPTAIGHPCTHEEPHVYETKAGWRFSWNSADEGPFDSEEEARTASTHHKLKSTQEFFAGPLPKLG